MSIAEDLRAFILSIDQWPIDQVHQAFVPELSDESEGFVYFARRGTTHERTMTPDGGPDAEQFDIEIYHPSIDIAESASDLIHAKDCYSGDFNGSHIGAFFVETQTDDYVPRVQFTDDQALHACFLSIEVRGYLGAN